jgi:RimJ/RimL family protein N-acetyltransferase
MRGRGLGRQALQRITDRLFRTGEVKVFVAHVKPGNVASTVAFLNAGFEFDRRVRVKGTECYQLVRRRP